ncbi:MAG: hypothetical protein ACOYCD_03280 [Kiritimatiellia bacterium]|jgi:hypothetical protein
MPDAIRHYWDCDLQVDLSASDGLEVEYTCDNPGAFQSITWYWRAGKGWRAAALPVRQGRTRHWIPKSDFEDQGVPDGWSATSGYRVSPWSAKRGAGRLILHAARHKSAAIAIARPGAEVFANAAERAFGASIANWIGMQLSEMGLPYAMISDEDLASRSLPQRYRMLILPCHPHLTPAMLKNIQRHLERQGYLFVCYSGDAKLGNLMGVQPGGYTAAERPGRWHAMSFATAPSWQGPPQVFQAGATYLITASAASKETKTLAWWLDAQGRRQSEAACLSSPKGIWMPHVPQADDAAAQRHMLAALLDQFLPGTLAAAARHTLDDVLAASPIPMEWEHAVDVDDLRSLRDQARAVLNAGDPAAAWRLTDKLSAALNARAAANMPKLGQGRRCIWVGTPMQAENWDRVAPKLAAAGLTDVFLHVPRDTDPNRDVFEACRRNGLKTHIWYICWNLDGLAATQIKKMEQDGRLQQSFGFQTTAWLCPSQTRNRELELARLEELADAVTTDGLHLDYIRYPDSQHCCCLACRKEFFAAVNAPETTAWPLAAQTGALGEQYRKWRAQQISEFVNACSKRLRQRRPGIIISAAVYPHYPECVGTEGQNWGEWLREDALDFVCPMNYTANPGEFAAWTTAQIALPGAAGRVLPGIGVASSAARLTPPEMLSQIQDALSAGADGYAIYALNHGLLRDLPEILTPANQPRSAQNKEPAATKNAQK